MVPRPPATCHLTGRGRFSLWPPATSPKCKNVGIAPVAEASFDPTSTPALMRSICRPAEGPTSQSPLAARCGRDDVQDSHRPSLWSPQGFAKVASLAPGSTASEHGLLVGVNPAIPRTASALLGHNGPPEKRAINGEANSAFHACPHRQCGCNFFDQEGVGLSGAPAHFISVPPRTGEKRPRRPLARISTQLPMSWPAYSGTRIERTESRLSRQDSSEKPSSRRDPATRPGANARKTYGTA